jgi:hypothetical protein
VVEGQGSSRAAACRPGSGAHRLTSPRSACPRSLPDHDLPAASPLYLQDIQSRLLVHPARPPESPAAMPPAASDVPRQPPPVTHHRLPDPGTEGGPGATFNCHSCGLALVSRNTLFLPRTGRKESCTNVLMDEAYRWACGTVAWRRQRRRLGTRGR